MKTFLVATNVEFSAIVVAEDKKTAVKLAKSLYIRNYGEDAKGLGFTAYTTEEYLYDYGAQEIEFLPRSEEV